MRRLVRRKGFAFVLVLGVLTASAALAMVRIGGSSVSGPAAVRAYDTSNPQTPVLTDSTGPLLQAGFYAINHDGLFVAAGTDVRLYDRRVLGQLPRAVWPAGGTVLGLADGPERELVLALDQISLRLVSFPDLGIPTVLWSYPIDESTLVGNPGRLMVHTGGYAYVADASLPGVRVLSIDPATPPTTVAVYNSPDGVVHDMTLWNHYLYLLTPNAFVVVDTGNLETPSFTRLGSYTTSTRAAGADANSRHAFVADGSQLLVLDIDPASPDFLGAPPLDSWTAPGPIRAVRLDKGSRAYVLVPGGYEILDVTPFGGR